MLPDRPSSNDAFDTKKEKNAVSITNPYFIDRRDVQVIESKWMARLTIERSRSRAGQGNLSNYRVLVTLSIVLGQGQKGPGLLRSLPDSAADRRQKGLTRGGEMIHFLHRSLHIFCKRSLIKC